MFNDPEFIWSCKETWLRGDNAVRRITESDSELKNGVRFNLTRINDDVISRLVALILSWFKMKRVMAMIILAKNQWIKKIKKETLDKKSKPLNVEMLGNAATVIFRMVQRKSFLEEVKALSSGTHNTNGVNRSSSLFKLDPFLDSNDVLRVGGRLSRSKLTSNKAHPVVLPKTSNITKAVVIWSHKTIGHGGRRSAFNNLRNNGIWVLRANAVVRRIIHKCVTCNCVESLVIRKNQFCQKKNVVKQLRSLTMVWTCLNHSSSDREGPILSDVVPYLPVLQVDQYILR